MQNIVNDRWIHPAVVLVATSLSDMDRLMPLALKQAASSRARLILLHVLAPGVGMPLAESAGPATYDLSLARRDAEEMLKPLCDSAMRQGFTCESVVREGDVAQQVSAAVREFEADMLIMGTPSRSKLGKLLFGSVAERVLRSTNLPVITAGLESSLPVAASDRKPVVVYASSLRGEACRPSAALACQMAASLGGKLIMLHVLPPLDGAKMMQKGLPMGTESEVIYELRSLAKEAGADAGIEVEPHVLYGNPSIEILAKATEVGASMIVLGAHRSAFESLTRKRIVYAVWAHAQCPVLTLRQSANTPAELNKENVEMHQ
jgi:nucleotide-binding universal stress UspA family protein